MFQFDLSIIFTALALVISLVTLWFSHLKGPDIELCNIPSVMELQDWSVHDRNVHLSSNEIPYYLSLKPVKLVFVNNGSRAGVIIDIEGKFKPSMSFKQFYQSQYGSAEYNNQVLPVSIKEGDTCVIEFSFGLRVFNWKRDFRYKEIKDVSNLREAFRKSIELDRTRFEKFVNFLRSEEPLGNLYIYMTYSGRKWLKTRIITREIANVEVKNNLKIALEGYEKLLENWDNLSAVNELLRKVPDIPDKLIEILRNNFNKLKKEVKVGSFFYLKDLSEYWRNLNQETNVIGRIIFEREKELMDEFEELSRQIKIYNSKLAIADKVKDQVKPKQIDDLNRMRVDLSQRISDALSKLNELKKKLTNEIL
ncbi:MAG: hypothetical protein ACTSQ8_26765 [Candidatus Helarchaeota archaeon]